MKLSAQQEDELILYDNLSSNLDSSHPDARGVLEFKKTTHPSSRRTMTSILGCYPTRTRRQTIGKIWHASICPSSMQFELAMPTSCMSNCQDLYFTFRIAKKRKSFLSHSYFWLSRSKEWGSESPIISMYSLIWIKSHHFWINKTVQMSESVVKIDKKSPFTTNGSASYPPCN